ncbi:DMT family transporter [Paracoccaceae bacterium GXU_MW_L88]
MIPLDFPPARVHRLPGTIPGRIMTLTIYQFAALGAALCWAFGGIISARAVGEMGVMRFNALRLVSIALIAGVWVIASGRHEAITAWMVGPILLSGFIGIFLGDTLLFNCIRRMGPRRTAVLFATNAPMGALLGWLFLGETLPGSTILAIAIIMAGVIIAIVFGKRASAVHEWESVKGPIWVGVALGLLAALGQAVGAIYARPVMAAGADPFTVMAVRAGISGLALGGLTAALPRLAGPSQFSPRGIMWTVISGIVGMGIGMSLLLFALEGGNVGVVTTLSATTPILVLPLLWMTTKEPPAPAAWLGAFCVVIGVAILALA